MLNIENSDKYFNNGLKISRIIFLFFLLILSFKNTDISFISVEPRKFLTEILLCGLFAALPYIAIGWKRGASINQILFVVFVTFIFFYVYSTLVEFSGINTYLNNVNIESFKTPTKTPTPPTTLSVSKNLSKKFEYTNLEKTLLSFSIIIIIILGYLAKVTHDWPVSLTQKDITIEILIFTILNTIPQIIIAINRNTSFDNIGKRLILSIIYYAIIYLISQRTARRIVGYFEEEAVISYTKYLNELDAGTIQDQPASEIAINYWNLPLHATLKDVVRAIRGDEAGHRDVNHQFADLINLKKSKNLFEKNKLHPQIHSVQTEACHPIAAFFDTDFTKTTSSLAQAIVDNVAHRKNNVIDAIQKSKGSGWVATDTEIHDAINLIKDTCSIIISPTAALSVAGLTKALKKGWKFDGPVVCLITGM